VFGAGLFTYFLSSGLVVPVDKAVTTVARQYHYFSQEPVTTYLICASINYL